MPETIKLTVRDLLKLHSGLKGLDGNRHSDKEFFYFDYDAGVRWNIGKNLAIVEREVEVYQKNVRAETRAVNLADGMNMSEIPTLTAATISHKIDALKDKEIELTGILFLKLEEIERRPDSKDPRMKDIKVNPIPPSILAALMPIIQGP